MATAFNTKTPVVDFSPFLKRDFSSENRGGALATAMEAVAELADGYGETKDKKLLSQYANETDASKVNNDDFYNSLNALNAKKIIEGNQDEARVDEINARNDAQYYIDNFNKEAKGDAINMSKDEFNKKYNNAGGLNWAMVQDVFNQKEDRTNNQSDRNLKNNLTNLQIQNTKNKMVQQQQEYALQQQQREQNNIDNKFLYNVQNGTIPVSEIDKYSEGVSPTVLNGIKQQGQIDDITSKYKSFSDFKNSPDWGNTSFKLKNELAKSKAFGNSGKSLTLKDQITQQRISNNIKTLPTFKSDFETKNGRKMTDIEVDNYIYNSEVPEGKKEEEKKQLPSKQVSEYQALDKYESILNELEETYDPSYVGGLDSSLNTISPNFILTDGHRKFNNLMNDVLLGKTSSLAGTLSDRDMALLQSSGLSEALGEKDFMEKLQKTKAEIADMKSKKRDLLKSQYVVPDDFFTGDEKDKTSSNKIDTNINWGNNQSGKKDGTNIPEIIKELKNPTTGEIRKWSNIRGFINE